MERKADNLDELQEELARTKKSEEMYRQLVQKVNSIILRMDSLGNIIFLNQFGLQFFGYEEGEILGRNVVGTIVPEVESSGRDLRFMIKDITVYPEKYENNINENMKSNEERAWIAWTNKPLYDNDGNVTEILCIGNDFTKQKKTEKALSESEEKFRTYVEAAPFAIFVAELFGRFIEFNWAAVNLLGYTAENLTRMSIFDIYPEEDLCSVRESFAELMAEGCVITEHRMKKSDGQIIWVSIHVDMISDQIFLAYCRDITKRKRNEETLRLNEERLRLAMEATKQGWFDLNIQTGEVVVSPEYPKILGYEPGELDVSLESWIRGIHPEDQDTVLKVFHECIGGKITRTMEYRRKTKLGEWKWLLSIAKVVGFDSNGKPLRMIGTHTDISDRKYAEEALRQSEEKFQKAFMLNPAPMMISSLESGIFVDINESFLKASEYDREEVIGKSTVEMDFVSAEARSALLNALAKDGKAIDVEMRVKIKSGKFRDARLSSDVVKIDETDCILTVLEDVTERKRTEQALAESRNYLDKIINAAADPIFVKDHEHRWILVNNAFCLFMGYNKDDLLGKSDYDFLPKEQANVFWSKDTFVLETGEENINEELLSDSEGVVHTVVTKKTLYTDEKGERFIVGIIRDISEQKKVENAMQENYHFLQTLIDAIPNPIFYKNTAGEYLGCNMAYEQTFGVQRDKFIGSTAFSIFPKHLAQVYYEMDLALLESSSEQIYESKAPYADGSEHDVVFYKAPYWNRDKSLAGLVGVILDITKQKKIENDLQQAKGELEQIIDFLPDATFAVDREGKVIAWNKAIELMTGIVKEDMLGRNEYEYAIPFYGTRCPILIDLVLRKSVEHEEKYRILQWIEQSIVAETYVPGTYQGKGAYLAGKASPLFDNNGDLIGAIESIRDITERTLTEDQLRQAKGELEQIFDFLPDATFAIDCDGRVIAWNKAIEQMTGVDKRSMLGKNNYEHAIPFYGERRPILIDLVLSKLDKEHEEKYQEIKQTDDLLIAETYVPNAYGGKGAYVSGRASPLFDIQGNLIGSVESVRDITRRKHSERIVLQQEKLRALGQLASGVVHDINNLLASVLGYIELLILMANRGEFNETQKKYITNIQRASQDIEKIISRLREFYQLHDPQTGPLPLVQINDIIPQAIDLTKPKWKDIAEKNGTKIDITTNLKPNLPMINASETQIREALINLIINSIDAMPEGGTITVRTKELDNNVYLEVDDNGTGMDEETLGKCLDPYFTTKGYQGTGMGLPMVFGIMQRHRGKLDMMSWPGKGTLSELVFPCAKNGEKEGNRSKRFSNPTPQRILCIDDEEYILGMVEELLKNDGHEPILAKGGNQGLEVFFSALEEKNPFDIVITDYGMEVDGRKVVDQIKKKCPSIPIIIFTGWGKLINKEDISEFNDCIIISKPDIIDLLDAIGQIIENKLAKQR
jgi:PAS domain S-box-containing protein